MSGFSQEVAMGGPFLSTPAVDFELSRTLSGPSFAAASISIDGILESAETCRTVSRGIEVATNNPETPNLNPGIIRT